ncbi:serine protease snake-like [Aricia agestis]|uniref:serine protease snake-like n=1 Tax=Aricia agestis TaxID=91739 RepID=UPI001C2017A4|nr:serine protease snake-like [Aricia agestis]
MLEFNLILLFLCVLIYITGISAQLSEEDLAKFISEAMQSNQTLDYDFGNSTEKPCEPYTPVKPVFTQNAISEIKCMEYIWEMENREKEAQWAERCRTYLIIQIKKGYFPEAFFFIKPPFIFGGIGAKPKEFPHMGAVGWRAKNTTQKWVYKCGSTLISDKFLLTAAHCSKLVLSRTKDVVNSVPEVVMLGLENLETDEFDIHGKPILQEIERIIVHPLYAPPKKYNDIALIEMKTAVRFAPEVQPACLWSREDVEVPGQNVTITGWGTTESGDQAHLLQKAVVDVLENRQCDQLLQDTRNRNWHGLVESQLCAGKLEGGVDTCQGDSGGPLQTIIPTETEGKIYRIMGVTSFGIKCGVQKRPGIYTRVSTYVDWIEGIVWAKNNIEDRNFPGVRLFKLKGTTRSSAPRSFVDHNIYILFLFFSYFVSTSLR